MIKAGPKLEGRIAILGSGREGLAAYTYIKSLGVADELSVITEGLSGREHETELLEQGLLKIQSFREAGLEGYDLLVRSPGVSLYRASLQAALASGVKITTPTSIWFQAHPDANTIVISGTKGKSTTCALLAHLLEHLGFRVRLAGNIGTPLLSCDDEGVDWWVIELSSFQIADLRAQPTFGVLLNLATDHLDWHGSEARYREDKLRLVDLVRPGRMLANESDGVLHQALAGRQGIKWFAMDAASGAPDGPLEVGGEVVMPASLPGKHNRANLAACMLVIGELGLDQRAAVSAVSTFSGLPHRLQLIGTSHGVDYIDDSISSAPVATLAALEALQDRTVVLLAGGFERGIDWAPYAREVGQYPPVAVIALPDNGPRILEALENAGVEPELGIFTAKNLEQAVYRAREIAPSGAVVLLSPGAPSFPHFRDYEDRGAQFAKLCGF